MNDNIIKQFIQKTEGMHKGEKFTLYKNGLAGCMYKLIIEGRASRSNDGYTEINFRNVTTANPESSIQFSIETSKKDRAGKNRITHCSFSIPKEMVEVFIEALKHDRSN